MRDIAQRCENVHAVVFHKSPSEGKNVRAVDYGHARRLSLDKLDKERDVFLDRNDAEHHVCGPENFMADMQQKVVHYRVGPERIRLEVFGIGAMMPDVRAARFQRIEDSLSDLNSVWR